MSGYTTMELYAARLLVRHLRSLYVKNRAKSYTLDAPFNFNVEIDIPDYDGPLVSFKRGSRLYGSSGTFHAYGVGVCDGATLASDKPRGVVEGTLAHDPAYLELDRIAEAWKNEPYKPGPLFKRDRVTRLTVRENHPTWTKADVRQFLDTLFANAMKKFGARKIVQRVYYNAVRYAGGVFRAIPKAFLPLAATLAILALHGCAGCLVPPDIADFPEAPKYTKQHE